MKALSLFLALALAACLPVFAQEKKAKKKSPAAADGVEMGSQKPMGEPIVYKTVEGRGLKLYVIKPSDWKATDKRPAIVFFHGGGWMIGKGAPTQFNFQGKYLASRGMVSIQVEYRLIANNRKEAPLGACQDAKSAMRWVRSHAAQLGIDPERIASGGGSAGGHLAAFVAMVDGTDDPQDDLSISCKPAAMVLFCPALLQGDKSVDNGAATTGTPDRANTTRRTDRADTTGTPEGADKTNTTNTTDTKKKPAVTGELYEAYKKISPYLNVKRGDPPGIILVGSEDGILPQDALKSFQEKCKEAGVRMDAVVYPGEGHSFFGLRRSLSRFYDTTIEMDKFLASLGWLTGPPTLTKDGVQAYAAEAAQNTQDKKTN